MARIFVLGAAGGVGSRALRQLTRRGGRGLDHTTLAAHMRGCDAVVSAAGAPDQGPAPAAADAVDYRGLTTAADTAVHAGIRRFPHISAFPETWRDRGMAATSSTT
jgi:uncharacterized protein YbjT (DUF2867 family)